MRLTSMVLTSLFMSVVIFTLPVEASESNGKGKFQDQIPGHADKVHKGENVSKGNLPQQANIAHSTNVKKTPKIDVPRPIPKVNKNSLPEQRSKDRVPGQEQRIKASEKQDELKEEVIKENPISVVQETKEVAKKQVVSVKPTQTAPNLPIYEEKVQDTSVERVQEESNRPLPLQTGNFQTLQATLVQAPDIQPLGSGTMTDQTSASYFMKMGIMSTEEHGLLLQQQLFDSRIEMFRNQWVNAPPLQPPKFASLSFYQSI